MKVFISQPMKGLTDEQILTVRKKAIRHLKKKLSEVFGVVKLKLSIRFFKMLLLKQSHYGI